MFKWIIGLLFGSCSIMLMPALPSTFFLLSSVLGSISVLYLIRSIEQPLFRSYACLFSGLLFGFGWSLLHATWQISQQIPSPINNSVHIIEAEVVSLPAIYPEYCQFRVKILQSDEKHLASNSFGDKKNLLLKEYNQQCDYQLGEQWWLEIKLKPIHGPVNQSGFDYELYAFEQGLDGKGYIRQSHLLKKTPALSINHLRQTLFGGLSQFQNAGLLQALLIGEKSNIPRQHKEQLRQLGLSHLIAISGLHISIIAGLFLVTFYRLIGWLNVLARRKIVEPYRFALMVSCLAALAYSVLADFAIPTVRALIMWCSIALMVIYKRQGAFLAGLKLALLLVLLIDPIAVISVSFWMSFIAVAVISLLVIGRLGQKPGWRNKFYQLIKLQICITLVLAIPSFAIFQQASLAGVVVNIVMIPLFSLILLPLIIIGTMLHSIFEISWLLSQIDHLISWSLMSVKNMEPTYELLSFTLFITSWGILGLIIASFLLLLPLSKLKLPFYGLIIVLGWLSLQISPSSNLHNTPKAIVFDVGHGLAILLTDGKHHILYDTGYATSDSSAFSSYIYPSFNALGITKLDALILSHIDNDHAGGAKTIIGTIPVDHVIAGDWSGSQFGRERRFGQKSHSLCQAGYELEVGTFFLKVLHPNLQGGARYEKNNDSCVIHVSSTSDKAFSILLTGDIEKEVEYQLAESFGQELQADVLIAPHHGSNSSSIYPFIKMVNPQLAVYSTERYSRYRLPSSKVIERYDSFDIKQLHTGCLGQITIDLLTSSYHYERDNRYIWRNKFCSVGKTY